MIGVPPSTLGTTYAACILSNIDEDSDPDAGPEFEFDVGPELALVAGLAAEPPIC